MTGSGISSVPGIRSTPMDHGLIEQLKRVTGRPQEKTGLCALGLALLE
jgi:hypothetical protein